MLSQDDVLEPVLYVVDIQGNILGGFNKDHQSLLGFTINDVALAREYFQLISKEISNLYEVFSFNNAYKSQKRRLGKEPVGLMSTWTNIAFSYDGMKKMIKDIQEIESFLDNSFINGLPFSSQGLGDPVEEQSEGNYRKWIIGSPKSIPDILFIVASDNFDALKMKSNNLINTAKEYQITNFYCEFGHDLSFFKEDKRGQEHFGFKDGISQPGVRGKMSNNPVDYLTSRPSNQPSDISLPEFSYTGRPLIAPGEFVIGYPTQSLNNARGADQVDPSIPKILINGSYLVYRRLRQDVIAFEKFVETASLQLSSKQGFSDITPGKFKALLVGRWPSGAPIAISSEKDDTQLGTDDYKNNSFNYSNDPNGLKAPVISHIRKVNPRDQSTDLGGPSRTLKKRIIRRGIPYGPPFDRSKHDSFNSDRGLLFLSYQSSIKNQFEFLTKNWMNRPDRPTNAPSPNNNDSGYDMLVGQNGFSDRIRYGHFQKNVNNNVLEEQVATGGLSILDWVIPTGGGYFFSPSIRSLKSFFGKK